MRNSPFSYGSPAPKRMRPRLVLIVTVGVMILFSVLVTFLSNDSSSTDLDSTLESEVFVENPTEAPVPAATMVPAIEPTTVVSEDSLGVTYKAIQKAYDTLSTDDWVVYARSLVNQHVRWQGQLQAIHASDELWFTIDPSMASEIPQTALHLSETGQTLTPGEAAFIEGEISRIVVFDRQVLVHIRDGQVITGLN